MKKPTTKKTAAKAKEPKAANSKSNSVDPEKRALFLSDKEAFAKASERLKKAQAAVRTLGKTIKADGFSLRQVKLAIQLETPEGEADFKSSVANDLLAAQYVGAAIGSQLAMFVDTVDRTPAVGRAYDEGQKASMTNGQPKPPYDPSTPQHSEWMRGFHDDTERRTKAGIGKLDS
jgi:hypothetical protein